ncbi:hypothetical protein UF10_05925 [Peptostreptococcus russellii]|uniref:DUF4367 domain-containing protein n=1 Tax=Peptostreptococcus russellii TaxID=215200 RepID=A0A2P7PZS9_9FIRM|nr:hypothetical protein [Peptostreptococcus russellii]PSJ31182.1 hypothetical protein UF10_05925 [Peptostreptococcus russellii]
MDKKNKIDQLFDQELENFIKSTIEDEFTPDEETKARIKARVKENIKNQENEEETMKNNELNRKDQDKKIHFLSRKDSKKKVKKKKYWAASVAALVLVVGLGSSLTIGKDFFTVTKEYKSGRLTILEETCDVDPSEIEMTLPKELDGKVFDKDGNQVKKLNGAMKTLYDENGEKITSLPIDGEGNYREEEKDTVEYVNYKTVEEAEKVLAFKPKVLRGFKIDKIEVMKDKKTGKISKEYATVYQSKGKDMITINERLASEETAYETSGENLKYVDIQGSKGILYNSYLIDVDTGDMFIGINGKYSKYRNDELVKLSQSLE